MARVRLASGVIDDPDRVVSHVYSHDMEATGARVAGIFGAFDALADNPLIGRPAGKDRRELLKREGGYARP